MTDASHNKNSKTGVWVIFFSISQSSKNTSNTLRIQYLKRRQNTDQYIEALNVFKCMNVNSFPKGKLLLLTLKRYDIVYCRRDVPTPLGGEEIHSNSVCCALESNKSTEKESLIPECYKKILNTSLNILR